MEEETKKEPEQPEKESGPPSLCRQELSLFPMVELIGVGENVGLGGFIQAMDGKAEFMLPFPAGFLGPAKVGCNGLPTLENAPFVHQALPDRSHL